MNNGETSCSFRWEIKHEWARYGLEKHAPFDIVLINVYKLMQQSSMILVILMTWCDSAN